LSVGLAFIVTLTASTSLGQTGIKPTASHGKFYRPVPARPIDKSYLHHSSTPLEGLLRGVASGIQAVGNFQLNLSQAAILYEHARSLALENRNRLFEFYAGINARREARTAEKRRKNEETRLQVYRDAYELSSHELDRQTGAIAWPEALRADEYADHRSRLEKLFRYRSSFGYSQTYESAEIQRQAQLLIVEFRKHRSNDVEGDKVKGNYFAAQNFLLGLKYEPSFSR
jgi:hypothetical protein